MGLSSNSTCKKSGTEEETSVHVLCECEDLASLRHAYLGSMGAIWNVGKGTGSFNLVSDYGAQRSCFKA
jgi:hypothetical protein